MKEISKKDLLNVILETAGEMDELAVRQKGVQAQRIDPTTGKPKIHKFVPGWFEGNETDTPDYWVVNKTGVAGEEILVVPLGCDELEDFQAKNSEMLDKITEQTNLTPMLTACKRTAEKPRNSKVGTPYQHSGKTKPAETNIKIDLHRLVFEYLGNPEMAAKLDRLSIPAIEARNEKNLNRYGEINNNVVQYQTHSFNSYTSANQFLQFVTARIGNKPLPKKAKSYHLARQFNQLYSNWEETKKNEKNFAGKTPAYKLDKFGFDEANLDVTVRTDLIINGKREGESFLWSVKLESKFGRKLQEQYTVSGGLKLNKEKTIVKSAQIEPNTEFTDSYTILDNLPIKTALVEALSEMQEYVLSLKPIEALKNANYKRPDITTKPVVNESEKERLQERLIKRITNS
jgi:hypothetical protein